MKVSAVIVNYYTEHLLQPLLEQLGKNPLVQDIIVVDNSLQLQDKQGYFQHAKTKLISNESNIGFGAAVNKAVRNINSNWLLVVNPDLRLLPGCIENLIFAAENFQSPVVGPRFYWDDDKTFKLPPATGQSWWFDLALQAGFRHCIDAELISFYWILRHDRFWQEKTPFYEPFLSGSCLLINLEWIRLYDQLELQVFDERFFLYFEDTDLCARVIGAEYRPLCAPGAEAVHYWNQAPGNNKQQMMIQAGQEFWAKYYGSSPDTQSMPGLAPQKYKDLGVIDENYCFTLPKPSKDNRLFFEIGVNSLFVPFAQCDLFSREFRFSESIWQKLSAGEYFSRIRHKRYGTMQAWKWRKG